MPQTPDPYPAIPLRTVLEERQYRATEFAATLRLMIQEARQRGDIGRVIDLSAAQLAVCRAFGLMP